ncbi:MAG: hypothetical protein JWN29_1126 [Acidimicrobiales bacterium]|jgi:hypothetical protein|nr:hypothetical protein [Acidimicrobiales bacterium]
MTFAHQGGWDEALFVLVPLVLFGWLLSRAQKRAERESAERRDDSE